MSWNDERTQRLLDISMVPNEVGLECSLYYGAALARAQPPVCFRGPCSC